MSSSDKKISLATAVSWTTNWRSAPSSSARAFLVPVEDLQGVLAEMGNPSTGCIRAYLGVDNTNGEEKLIIVGTKKDKSGVYRDLLPDAGDGDGDDFSIWDFSTPCPPDCDDDSALN